MRSPAHPRRRREREPRMYSTCLFCNQDLGSNEVIEQFPIGRRLAFDAYESRRVRARLRLPNSDTVVPVRKKQLEKVAIVRANDDWAIRVPLARDGVPTVFTGRDALQAASKLLPAINERGARAGEVQSA